MIPPGDLANADAGTQSLNSSALPSIEDELHRLRCKLEDAEREIKRLSKHDDWRRIAQAFTPGGSEYQTPEEVEAYMHHFKEDNFNVRVALARFMRETVRA